MNADRIARAYRWIEYAAFGRALERARFDFLPLAAEASRILILGEGDGRFLDRLLRSNPRASVAVVEASARMIDMAKRRISSGDLSRVEFHQSDAATGHLPQGPFDLAVTHFFLDILECAHAKAVIASVSALLAPGAIWLVSEFQIPDGRIRQLHARIWLFAMFRFFSLATGLLATKLPPYRNQMECSGLIEIDYRERRLGLIRSQVWRKPI